MVIGRQAWTKLRSHPHIVNACRGNSTGRGNVTRQEVADLFELAEVVVGDSVPDSRDSPRLGDRRRRGVSATDGRVRSICARTLAAAASQQLRRQAAGGTARRGPGSGRRRHRRLPVAGAGGRREPEHSAASGHDRRKGARCRTLAAHWRLNAYPLSRAGIDPTGAGTWTL
jgi:hypothetical protein